VKSELATCRDTGLRARSAPHYVEAVSCPLARSASRSQTLCQVPFRLDRTTR
jgi:hypothetical protein